MLEENLIKIYETSFRENREMPALTDYFKGETFSYYEMAKEIAKLHLLFKKAGVKKGDKIALIGRNNPRWCITYIATISYGAVIVPILQDFAPADIIHIINHSESKLLFLGDNFWDIIEEDQIRQIEAVFSLTDFHAIYERNGKALTKFQRDILKNYRSKYPRGFSVNDIKYPEIPNDEVILLNYTSGTTGYSKGVMLTVNNLTGNVSFARGMVNTQTGTHYFRKGGRTLSFLPLAHAYGCAFDFLSPLAVGGHITLLGKIPSPKILLEAMSVVKPTIICCVPMILEKVYRKQVMPMLEKGPMSIAVKIPLLNTAIYSVIRKKTAGCLRRQRRHIHRRRRPDESGDRIVPDEDQVPDHHRLRHDRMRAAHQFHTRQRIQGGLLRPLPERSARRPDRLPRPGTRGRRNRRARRACDERLLQERKKIRRRYSNPTAGSTRATWARWIRTGRSTSADARRR